MGLAFIPGYNAYDLAKEYASKYSAEEQQGLKIQFHCGTTCFNYVNSERYLQLPPPPSLLTVTALLLTITVCRAAIGNVVL